MADVVCLGHICADAIAKPVDGIPEKGKLNLIEQIELHTGGCASNAAIDLAKIGISTAIIGKIGRDGFGQFVYNAFIDAGLNVDGLKRVEDENTSATMVMVDGEGERTFLHCAGTNGTFSEQDVDYEIMKEAKILFVAGSLLMPQFDGKPAAQVLKKAKEMGLYTILDTAWDSTGRWMSAVAPCLPYLDLFIPSEDEAQMLCGKDGPEEMADSFLAMGAENVVIKLGKKGCFIKNKDMCCHVPGFTVDAVDATGAGDSFVAGFITGLIKGWPLSKCAIFANAVGAHCVMAVGATAGVKPYEDIKAFLMERNHMI